MSRKIMRKHPLDRKVFFVLEEDNFLSAKEVKELAWTGKLDPSSLVFDTDGEAFLAQHIAANKAPRWLQNEHADLMLQDIPPPTESQLEMVNEVLSEPDSLEMPEEPSTEIVSQYLASQPRIVLLVAEAEHRMFRLGYPLSERIRRMEPSGCMEGCDA